MAKSSTSSLSWWSSNLRFGQRVAQFIVTCGGVGLVPKAPGTAGAAVGLLFFLCISHWSWQRHALGLMVLTGISVWAINQVEKHTGLHDDGRIVVDEFVGVWLALVFFPVNGITVVLAFVLFRFFDIVKIYPADYADQNIKNGWGVMLDDIISGIYASALLYPILRLLKML